MSTVNRKSRERHKIGSERTFFVSFFRNSSNSADKICDSWVLSTSVGVARSPVDFCYATTEAERRPLVVSVPLLLRTQLARAAQEVRGTSDLRGPEWNGEPRDAKFFY